MTLDTFNRAFADAGIDPAVVTPVISIGAHYVPAKGGDTDAMPTQKWAVYLSAANAWAFLLPLVDPMQVFDVAKGVCRWDMAMAEHQRPADGDITKAMWAALVMDDCPLKRVIDSAHPPL